MTKKIVHKKHAVFFISLMSCPMFLSQRLKKYVLGFQSGDSLALKETTFAVCVKMAELHVRMEKGGRYWRVSVKCEIDFALFISLFRAFWLLSRNDMATSGACF